MSTKVDDAFLIQMRERFKRCVEAERDIRAEAAIDLAFVVGDQWDAKAQRDRQLSDRPALVFNKLTGPLQQVANDARQNKPSIQVNPVDSGADKDTADVLEGIVRHVEYISKADVAYDTALEYAASCSFGYFGYTTKYVSEDSFDQEIVCRTISDPFSVYLDPDAKEADRSDMRFAFVVDSMSREAFEEKYPDSELVQAAWFDSGDCPAPEWLLGEKGVQIAEYWTIKTKARKLLLLSTGDQLFEDELDKLPRGITVKRSRSVDYPQVCQYITNGVEVLEENEWAGKWIPLIPVFGKEVYANGKRYLISLIRNARDAQRLHNFYKSNEAEAVGLAPRPKWVGYVGQFKTKQKDWANPTSKTAYLEADMVTVNGQPAPLPRWEAFDPPISALSAGALQSADDIKAATNIYDASLGQRSNETSGIAIQRRQTESDISNYHFIDNLSRAQRHAGNILVDLIPKIYDTAREVRIIGEDQTQKIVKVNQQYQDEAGKTKKHDLGVGRYDVTITTGPSYTTKRQEAFDMLGQLAKAYPPLMQLAGDVVFRNSDIPGADEVADRLKKMLPPQLQENPQGQAPLPPQVQAHIAQMQQTIQAMGQALDEANRQVQVKKMELESRERIAGMNNQAMLAATDAKLGSAEGIAMLNAQMAAIQHRLDMLHEGTMLQAQGQQNTQAAQQQAGIQQQQTEQAQQFQAQQAAQQQAAQAQQQQQPQQ